jgi:hypothetical protein
VGASPIHTLRKWIEDMEEEDQEKKNIVIIFLQQDLKTNEANN